MPNAKSHLHYCGSLPQIMRDYTLGKLDRMHYLINDCLCDLESQKTWDQLAPLQWHIVDARRLAWQHFYDEKTVAFYLRCHPEEGISVEHLKVTRVWKNRAVGYDPSPLYHSSHVMWLIGNYLLGQDVPEDVYDYLKEQSCDTVLSRMRKAGKCEQDCNDWLAQAHYQT